MLSAVAAVVALAAPSLAITCWKCASHNADWGCLDPFDYQPFVQVRHILSPFLATPAPLTP